MFVWAYFSSISYSNFIFNVNKLLVMSNNEANKIYLTYRCWADRINLLLTGSLRTQLLIGGDQTLNLPRFAYLEFFCLLGNEDLMLIDFNFAWSRFYYFYFIFLVTHFHLKLCANSLFDFRNNKD